MTPDTIRQLAATWRLELARVGRWYLAYTGPAMIACVASDPAPHELRPDALRVIEPSVAPLGTVTAEALCAAVGTVEALSTACWCGGTSPQRCTECDGRGRATHSCPECNHVHDGTCSECGGTGQVECDECVAGRRRLPLAQCELAIGPHRYDRWQLARLVPHLAGSVTVYVQPAGELTLASGEVRVAAMRLSEHGWAPGEAPKVGVRAGVGPSPAPGGDE